MMGSCRKDIYTYKAKCVPPLIFSFFVLYQFIQKEHTPSLTSFLKFLKFSGLILIKSIVLVLESARPLVR